MEVSGISQAAMARGIGSYAQQATRTAENPAQPAAASGRSVTDIVKLSSRSLHHGLFGDDSVLNNNGDVNLTKSFEARFAAFQTELGSLFRANGIDTSQPIELRTDAQGHVRVINDHPDKEKIEALFADNPELANQFRGLSSMAALLKAAEEHVEFARAYEADPEAALGRYGHLFEGNRDDVTFRFSHQSLEVLVASPAGGTETWWTSKDAG